MKNILVTGGAGFIGSNFIRYLLQHHPAYRVVNFDLLTYAGNLENLEGVDLSPRYVFVKADICGKESVDKVFREHAIDAVVHFAAESHVDRSILDLPFSFRLMFSERVSSSKRQGSLASNDLSMFRPTKSTVRWARQENLPKQPRCIRTAPIRRAKLPPICWPLHTFILSTPRSLLLDVQTITGRTNFLRN